MSNNYIQVEDDPFKTSIIYDGISKTDSKWLGLTRDLTHTSFIKSFKDKNTGEFTHELYATITYYGNWHNFERAAFRGGEEAGLNYHNRTQVNCYRRCKLTERFSISLEQDFLTNNTDGFDVKVFAESGKEVILTVTNLQISGQLSYLGIN